MASFGEQVILVNSTNHVEGPGSDFARAADAAGGRDASGALSAMVGNVGRGVRLMAYSALGLFLMPRQLAVAGGGAFLPPAGAHDVRMALAASHGPSGRARNGRPGARGPRPAGPRPDGPPPRSGGANVPPGLGGFLGGFTGVPRPARPPRPPRPHGDADAMLTGMTLGALLGSLAGSSATTAPSSEFRGYRLVENVVPLGSPVYSIGELYRLGERVYMGASLAADYPTSFFAARPEAEVISSLGG